MKERTASAIAFANIAFIKYWGNRDEALRLPVNGSISMNLAGLETRTSVTFSGSNQADSLTLNGLPTTGTAFERVSAFLDIVRQLAKIKIRAEVNSENNFPAGAGIASSAAAFAALALAASKAPDSIWMKPAFRAWPGVAPARPAAPSRRVCRVANGHWRGRFLCNFDRPTRTLVPDRLHRDGIQRHQGHRIDRGPGPGRHQPPAGRARGRCPPAAGDLPECILKRTLRRLRKLWNSTRICSMLL